MVILTLRPASFHVVNGSGAESERSVAERDVSSDEMRQFDAG